MVCIFFQPKEKYKIYMLIASNHAYKKTHKKIFGVGHQMESWNGPTNYTHSIKKYSNIYPLWLYIYGCKINYMNQPITYTNVKQRCS